VPMHLPKWIFITAGVIFLVIAVLPVGLMFAESFQVADRFSLENYQTLLTSSRQRELLSNSLVLALATGIFATLLGAPLGFLLAKLQLPSRNIWRLCLMIPLLVPSYILGIAWVFAGRLLTEALSRWTFSLPGAVAILALSCFPIPMLVAEGALSRVPARLEEAAWVVAGWRRTLFSITLPLVLPSLAAGFLLVFVLALAEFSVPSLLRVRVFSTEAYTRFAAFFNFGAATAATAPLLLLTLVLAICVRFLVGEKWIATRRSSGASPLLLSGSWTLVGTGCFSVIIFLGSVLPLLCLAARMRHLETFLRSAGGARSSIAASLLLSVSAAFLSIAIGLLLGYWRARTQARLKTLADVFWILIYTLPATVLGIGTVQLWSRPLTSVLYGTWAILLLGLLARFVPIAALLLAAGVRQMPESLEEAALVHGSSWWRTLVGILIPNLKQSLVAAGLLVFILAFGEVALPLLLIPAGNSTLPLQIFTTITNSPDDVMAALCLLQVLVILITLLAAGLILGRKRDQLKIQTA
jgi:iron(III) transport system permease protein